MQTREFYCPNPMGLTITAGSNTVEIFNVKTNWNAYTIRPLPSKHAHTVIFLDNLRNTTSPRQSVCLSANGVATRYSARCNVTLVSPFRLLRDGRFAQNSGHENNWKTKLEHRVICWMTKNGN